MSSRIRAVSFDADNTLWDFAQVMRAAMGIVLRHLRSLGVPGSESLTVERMIAVRDEVAAERTSASLRLEEIRERALARTLEELGRPDPAMARELTALYLRHRFRDIRLYDDVLPALDALAPSRRIGLLTNGNSYPEKYGLAGRFDFRVHSQDYGIEKPDPRLFRIAVEQAGCDAAQMVHVGDSLENDVAGALAVGLHAVWLNREGRPAPDKGRMAAEVRSLAELPALIATLEAGRGPRTAREA